MTKAKAVADRSNQCPNGHTAEVVYMFGATVATAYFNDWLVSPWSAQPVVCSECGVVFVHFEDLERMKKLADRRRTTHQKDASES